MFNIYDYIDKTNLNELYEFISYLENTKTPICSYGGGEMGINEDGMTYGTFVYPIYTTEFENFINCLCKVVEPEMKNNIDYREIINRYKTINNKAIFNLFKSKKKKRLDFIRNANEELIVAIIIQSLRAERFYDGYWIKIFKSGDFAEYIKRLKELLNK